MSRRFIKSMEIDINIRITPEHIQVDALQLSCTFQLSNSLVYNRETGEGFYIGVNEDTLPNQAPDFWDQNQGYLASKPAITPQTFDSDAAVGVVTSLIRSVFSATKVRMRFWRPHSLSLHLWMEDYHQIPRGQRHRFQYWICNDMQLSIARVSQFYINGSHPGDIDPDALPGLKRERRIHQRQRAAVRIRLVLFQIGILAVFFFSILISAKLLLRWLPVVGISSFVMILSCVTACLGVLTVIDKRVRVPAYRRWRKTIWYQIVMMGTVGCIVGVAMLWLTLMRKELVSPTGAGLSLLAFGLLIAWLSKRVRERPVNPPGQTVT